MAIQIKTLEQLKIMRRAGLLVGETLELLKSSIKVGMRTDALDAIAAANIKRGGGTSNFKGYYHLESSKVIERCFKNEEPSKTFTVDGKDYNVGEEIESWKKGILTSPPFVTFLMMKEFFTLFIKSSTVLL